MWQHQWWRASSLSFSFSLSLSFSFSLSISLSLLYFPCVLSISSTTYTYNLKSSFQVIQSVVQSYDTLIKSVVSKHHQKCSGNLLSTKYVLYLVSSIPTTYYLSLPKDTFRRNCQFLRKCLHLFSSHFFFRFSSFVGNENVFFTK